MRAMFALLNQHILARGEEHQEDDYVEQVHEVDLAEAQEEDPQDGEQVGVAEQEGQDEDVGGRVGGLGGLVEGLAGLFAG